MTLYDWIKDRLVPNIEYVKNELSMLDKRDHMITFDINAYLNNCNDPDNKTYLKYKRYSASAYYAKRIDLKDHSHITWDGLFEIVNELERTRKIDNFLLCP